MKRADGLRVAHSQAVELGSAELPGVVIHFIDGQHHWFLGGTQHLGGGDVRGSHALHYVGHQDDHIGVGHRHLGLLLDQLPDDAFRVGLQTAGVQQDEMEVFPPGVGHQTVAGGAGHIADDGLTPADDPVEEGRLADVRPADDCDYGDCQINTTIKNAQGSGAFLGRTQFPASRNSKTVFWTCSRLCAWENATDCGCSSMPSGTSSP